MIVRDEHYYFSGSYYSVFILIFGGAEGRVLGWVRKVKVGY